MTALFWTHFPRRLVPAAQRGISFHLALAAFTALSGCAPERRAHRIAKDAGYNDAAGNDAAGNDAAGNDAAGNDAAGNDAVAACGGAPCNGVCVSGRCLVELADVASPTDVAVRDGTVYATSCESDDRSSVVAVPTEGGPVITLASGRGCAAGLAIDGTGVYAAGLEPGTVVGIPLLGGVPTVLATDVDAPVGIAVSKGDIYVTAAEGLVRVPIAGGAARLLASDQKSWTVPVTDDTDVYFGDPDQGTIRRFGLESGAPETVTVAERATSLALGSSDVYFASGYLVMKAPKEGGSVTTVGTAAGAEVVAITVDEASVYFTSYGGVWKIPLTGGLPIALAGSQTGAIALAVDDESVYWVNPAAADGGAHCCGKIMKLSPK
jgi:hypothetical protein